MNCKIALAGNPNSGKTTLFNALTGSSQYVGNWPGVTVEKKEGRLRSNKQVTLTDLPGVYSLSPYTPEELITRNYLTDDRPDALINLVDASNLERNLYLTTQLLDLGIPMVIALNMIDIVQKNGDRIDTEKLINGLGCSAMEISALKGICTTELAQNAVSLARNPVAPRHCQFAQNVENVLMSIAEKIQGIVPAETRRWYSIKIFERDQVIWDRIHFDPIQSAELDGLISEIELSQDDDSESIIVSQRYEFVGNLIGACLKKKKTGETTSDKIDRIVTNRWLALPIFALVMFVVYFVSVSWIGAIVTDWTNDTLFAETIQPAVSGWMESVHAADWLVSLVIDAIIGGVGAVLGFVPQMFVLFFFLSILEDCGYMARVAFIMDRIFRKFGLSGKSFIPMLVSSGCGVPGVMATKTIENEKDRRMTVMTTTFIPCGAKLPVIALIGGAMFPSVVWMAPAMYFLGIAAVLFSGVVLKKSRMFAGDPAPFVMELPQYHIPAASGVLLHMWERGKSFIIKAGTIIFLACAVIWFLSGFGFTENGFGMVGTEHSLLAAIGTVIAPLFAPLGFGSWKAAVATISGLVAKENVVGTFGVLFSLGEVAEDDAGLLSQVALLFPTTAAAASFLVFNLLCAPCFAAIGAIRREMNSVKWTWFAIGYQTVLAYVVAFLVYQLGGVLFCGMAFGLGTGLALLLLTTMILLLLKPSKTTTRLKSKEVSA